ncbi:hypothetical protein FCOIX_3201 [Fusarium coicis]|nr:hypothetical protein FCOIX_3201 [Fusarium coicis]
MSYHVHTGYWRNHDANVQNQFIYTVSDTVAMILTTVMGAFISIVGSRAWVIVRRFAFWFCRKYGPTRTNASRPGSLDEPSLDMPRIDIPLESLEESSINTTGPPSVNDDVLEDFGETDISQSDALLAWMPRWRKNQNHKVLGDSRWLRSFLCLAACIWAVFCVVLGLTVVYISTTLGDESPTVQSEWTPCCGRLDMQQILYPAAAAKEAERYVLGCKEKYDNDLRDCGSFWSGRATPEVVIHNTTCPFKGQICSEKARPISLQHNMTASYFGYNSPSKVTLHHRLTCAALDLSHFIWPEALENGKHLLSFQNIDLPDDEWIKQYKKYSVWLETMNGPNKLSSNRSGWDGHFHFGEEFPFPKDMTLVLIPAGAPDSLSVAQRQLDPRLRHPNATTFIILVFPGQNVFFGAGPMTDPMFHASQPYHAGEVGFGKWLPDHEVNGVGCVEQYKLCSDDRHCSGWRSTFDSEFLEDGQSSSPPGELCSPLQDQAEDQLLLFYNAFKYSSVFGYLLKNRRLLIAASRRSNTYGFIKKDQWVEELQGLFDAAFLRAHCSGIKGGVDCWIALRGKGSITAKVEGSQP